MEYDIEFKDCGQDLLRLRVDAQTGEILDAGLMNWLYADGKHYVNVGDLENDRMVHHAKDGEDWATFKWPMVKLSYCGEVIRDAT